jgi:hypothetical protein
MPWYQVFQDGPEYEARRKRGTFVPPNVTLKTVRDAVPAHLFERSTPKSLFYIIRHILVTYAIYYCGSRIAILPNVVPFPLGNVISAPLWILYWGWQGMSFAGIWALGTYEIHFPEVFFSESSHYIGHEVCSIDFVQEGTRLMELLNKGRTRCAVPRSDS